MRFETAWFRQRKPLVRLARLSGLCSVRPTPSGSQDAKNLGFSRRKVKRGLFRGVEEVVSGVWHADFLANVRSVAAGRWCFATFGVEALDGCGAREHAATIVAEDVDEKPWNGISVRRRRIGNGFAGNTAAVTRFPGRSGEMFTEGFAILVEELGVGSLQGPSELRGVTPAGVDLVALRMDLEKKLFLDGWLDLLRHLLRGNRERKNRARGGEERGGCESANAVAHGTFPPVRAQLGFEAQYNSIHLISPFLAFVLRDPRFHQFLDKCSRQWLVRGEVDGPFGCGEALKLVLKRFDNRGSGEQTAVVRKRGEPHQHSFVLECRNPIADGLGSLRWHSGSNRRANLVQGAAGGLRDTSKVFSKVLWSAIVFRRRTAIARFHFFHAGNATRTSTSSPCPRPPCSRST